jgi:peroxiredoxin Q/BCP
MASHILQEGDLLPDFELYSTSGQFLTKTNILGKNALFFIYPKDDTSSCTNEAKGFSEYKPALTANGVEVFGISKDSIESHQKFISKHSLTVELLSDENLTFISSIGAWVEKTMYGKKYMGVERTSLLVSETGKIVKIWRKVRVKGHVTEVLAKIIENNQEKP